MEVLKISTNSQPKSVAGAIAAVIRNNTQLEIQAIGAGSVNQAVKSIAIARGYVAPNGIDLVCIPAFSQTEVNGELKTSIVFTVCKR
jgi:stage V sporulation protein S